MLTARDMTINAEKRGGSFVQGRRACVYETNHTVEILVL